MYSFSCSLFRWGWRYLCLRSPSLWCQASAGSLLATVVSPCRAPARLVLWQSWWSYTSIKREKGLCSNSAASDYLTIKVKVILCVKSTFLFLTLTAALSHSQIPKIFFLSNTLHELVQWQLNNVTSLFQMSIFYIIYMNKIPTWGGNYFQTFKKNEVKKKNLLVIGPIFLS